MDRGPRIPAFAVMADPANAGRTSLQRSDQRRVRKDHAETSAKGHLSGRGPRHAIFAGDQGHAEGYVDGVDKPLIQYAVEKALTASIKQIILVTKRSKSALEDHFDKSPELEATMWARGKSPVALEGIRMQPGSPVYVRQQESLGLGHSVWCTREIVGDEPFAVLLPDELMVGLPGFLEKMVVYTDFK